MPLSSTLLEQFMNTFYGYGNYDGRMWFIGMEEGGGNSLEEINRRLNVWELGGRRELEDAAEFHFGICMPRFFSPGAPLQPTWNRLIRIFLSSQGKTPTTEMVRKYQIYKMGRTGGNTCVVELLPLPSPSTGHWLYEQVEELPYLKSREAYREAILPRRIRHLQLRIRVHKPPVVIFYSFSYQQHWQVIVNGEFTWDSDLEIFTVKKDGTLFVITKHPVARGLNNDYFHRIGKYIVYSDHGISTL
jgi:hypothetical protein